jgi:outer membrane protein assembly factor BamA
MLIVRFNILGGDIRVYDAEAGTYSEMGRVAYLDGSQYRMVVVDDNIHHRITLRAKKGYGYNIVVDIVASRLTSKALARIKTDIDAGKENGSYITGDIGLHEVLEAGNKRLEEISENEILNPSLKETLTETIRKEYQSSGYDFEEFSVRIFSIMRYEREEER